MTSDQLTPEQRSGTEIFFGTRSCSGAIGILFTQRMKDSPEPPRIFTDFWTLAYGAMEWTRSTNGPQNETGNIVMLRSRAYEPVCRCHKALEYVSSRSTGVTIQGC